MNYNDGIFLINNWWNSIAHTATVDTTYLKMKEEKTKQATWYRKQAKTSAIDFHAIFHLEKSGFN